MLRAVLGRLTLLLVVVLLATAATAAARPQSTWTTHRSTSGFTVSTPSSWIDVTRLTPQFLAKAAQLPGLSAYADLVKKTKTIKLLVADVGPTAVSHRFSSSLNVLQVPAVGDLELQRDVEIAQLRSSGLLVGQARSGYVRLPAGKALRVSYHANYGGSSPTVAITQYLFVHGGRETGLTYSTLPSLAANYRPVFARSVASFRFTG
jgi:hypothetical protein